MNMEEFEVFLLNETTAITGFVFDRMIEICSKFDELKKEVEKDDD